MTDLIEGLPTNPLMKPKAKTLQERLGFLDDELTKPEHDEMMIWLDANIDTIVVDLFPTEWTAAERAAHERQIEDARLVFAKRLISGADLAPDVAQHARLLKAEIEHWRKHGDVHKEREHMNRLDGFLRGVAADTPVPAVAPDRPPFRVVKKEWEVPVLNGTFPIGFIDFSVTGVKSGMRLDGIEEHGAFNPVWKPNPIDVNLLFEVKPKIDSLGALMRQINKYRIYKRNSQILVLSPDERFRHHIESQDIRFVKYPR